MTNEAARQQTERRALPRNLNVHVGGDPADQVKMTVSFDYDGDGTNTTELVRNLTEKLRSRQSHLQCTVTAPENDRIQIAVVI